MKSLNQYITEKFVNAAGSDDIKKLVSKYGKVILEILDYGYKDIGGCLGMQTEEDLINECDFIKLFRAGGTNDKEGEIVAVACYADKAHPNSKMPYTNNRADNAGRKIIACAASEGNSQYLARIITEDFKDLKRNVWGEFSGKMATFALKCGALPIPVDTAEAIMSHKHFEIKKEDGYFYTRKIAGQLHTKIIMGNHLFYSHCIDDKLSQEDIDKFKKLAIKYDQEDKANHI